jgi:hypothetical protein
MEPLPSIASRPLPLLIRQPTLIATTIISNHGVGFEEQRLTAMQQYQQPVTVPTTLLVAMW